MRLIKFALISAVLILASIFVTGGGGCKFQGKIGKSKVFGIQFRAGVQNITGIKGILRADPRA